MSRKHRKSRGLSTASEPCQESVATYKARVTKAKKQLKAILELYKEDSLHYDIQNEVVGRAYLKVMHAKQELEHRRRSR